MSSRKVSIDVDKEVVVTKDFLDKLYKEIDELKKELSKLRYFKRVDADVRDKD